MRILGITDNQRKGYRKSMKRDNGIENTTFRNLCLRIFEYKM